MADVSKRTRFEVFKRDGFQCQYCGRTPPAVTLEVDHINPKANGGKSDINNYVTACMDCNRGKGPVLLDSIPDSLQTKLAEMKERQDQLKAFSKFLEDQDREVLSNTQRINEAFVQHFPGMALSESFQDTSVRRFLHQLPVVKIVDAMNIAATRWEGRGNYGAEKAVKYFCGICWKWIKDPSTRDW